MKTIIDKSSKLTKRQKEVLEYLKRKQILITPTHREIAQHFGFSLAGAQYHIANLIKKGYMENVKKYKRGYKIIDK